MRGALTKYATINSKSKKVLSENAEALCFDPFALPDFLAANSKCKYAAKPYKASLNYFKY